SSVRGPLRPAGGRARTDRRYQRHPAVEPVLNRRRRACGPPSQIRAICVHSLAKENDMLYRVLPLFVVALVLALYAGTPLLADDEDTEPRSGTVVSVSGTKLVMTDKAGKEHSHTVAKDAKVTLDGRDAKLADLQPGMKIKVTTPKNALTRATKIEAEKK